MTTPRPITDLRPRLDALAPIHFIGMGGSGMAPLATLVRRAGVDISGSDSSKAVLNFKDLSGVPFCLGHDNLELILKAKTVVISSAIQPDNPELLAAIADNKTILHRSELLALISKSFKTITVSGTHGKSTTSALIAYILLKMNLDPSFILGAKILDPTGDSDGAASRLGSGEYLVLESDESDGSFQRYHPFVAVVTNIDEDHLDFYGSMAAVEEAFHKHLLNVDPEGKAVVFWDHPRVRALSEKPLVSQRLTYGTYIGSEVRMLSQKQSGTTQEFEAVIEQEKLHVRLPLIGKHNGINALAALAVIRALGLTSSRAVQALETFPGVSRRLSLYYEDTHKVVYDDYAHNPVKISSCLMGVRSAFPESFIVCVFQAHRFSRLRHMYQAMLSSFSSVDHVVVAPVFSAGEPVDDRFQPEALAADIKKLSQVSTISCQSLKEASKLLQLDEHSNHTVYVTVGAGDVWTVARDFAQHLKSHA